jgi:hypothetical protein
MSSLEALHHPYIIQNCSPPSMVLAPSSPSGFVFTPDHADTILNRLVILFQLIVMNCLD